MGLPANSPNITIVVVTAEQIAPTTHTESLCLTLLVVEVEVVTFIDLVGCVSDNTCEVEGLCSGKLGSGKFRPQYLQTIASSFIFSAQYGHFFIFFLFSTRLVWYCYYRAIYLDVFIQSDNKKIGLA